MLIFLSRADLFRKWAVDFLLYKEMPFLFAGAQAKWSASKTASTMLSAWAALPPFI